MDSKTKVWTIAGVVVIVALIGAFAWTQMDHTPEEREVSYGYEVRDVRMVEWSEGESCLAFIYFDTPLPEGVRMVCSYQGVTLCEYINEWDDADMLQLRIYPASTMDLDDVRDHMVIEFYA